MTTNSLIERHLEGIADYLDPEVIGDSEAMHDAPGKLREAAAELRRVSTECAALRSALRMIAQGTEDVAPPYRSLGPPSEMQRLARTTLQQTNKESGNAG